MDWVCPTFSRDVDSFALLIRSFQKFWGGDGRLFVLVPDADRPLFSPLVRKFSVVAQESLLPPVWFAPRSRGWYRQQALKLAASSLVSSPVYGVIDADCFLARPFVAADHATPGATRWELRPHTNTHFYPGSAELLGVSVPPQRFLWRPPFFFETAVVQQLLRKVDNKHLVAWQSVLATSHPWGEVPLYHLMLEHLRVPYAVSPSVTHEPIRWPKVDVEADFARWDPAETFSGKYAFGVIHTHSGIDVARVREKVEGYI